VFPLLHGNCPDECRAGENDERKVWDELVGEAVVCPIVSCTEGVIINKQVCERIQELNRTYPKSICDDCPNSKVEKECLE
jgi:hypothetical protein